MFFSNCVVALLTLMVIFAMPVGHAQQAGALYTAKPGDCLSGIVKAHYPATTGHYFVLRANPDIVDENQIHVGQTILLPWLSDEQLLSTVDQTGCSAASLSARNANRVAITKKAGFIADTRLASNKKPFTDKRSSVDAPASTTVITRRPIVEAMPLFRPATVTGTQAVPIDASQRTTAVRPSGRPTRVSAPKMSKPQFAVDDERAMQSNPYRQSTPNRYVVNAIGARTLTATNALVQHSDQNFYVESRTDWQNTVGEVTHQPGNNRSTPTNHSDSNVATALEQTLTRTRQTKTKRAGNIIIDESLLLKAAAQPGGKP